MNGSQRDVNAGRIIGKRQVMEYLEGETLAHRLKKGALPLDQTLRYAIEIASALDEVSSHSCFQFRQAKPTTRNNSLASKGFCSTFQWRPAAKACRSEAWREI
jgi:hypothetical protein